MTEIPVAATYASVVSQESVHTALTLAALDALDVLAGDVQNAYLTAPVTEKIWTICGPNFGPGNGRKALMIRALYGLKSSGATFHNHLASCL
jgi:hypothetical protein